MRVLIAMCCLCAAPAWASEFQGVIEAKMSGRATAAAATSKEGERDGTMTMSIAPAGVRMEIKANVMDSPVGFVSLIKASDPDTVYQINDVNKAYVKTDLKASRERRKAKDEAGAFTLKRLGRETMLGRSTEHVLVTGKDNAQELWIDTSLKPPASMTNAFESSEMGLFGKLRAEGLEGFPLKVLSKSKNGEAEGLWEATRIEPKRLPSSLFEIPAGYTQGHGFGAMMTPEMREKMLKNLTPEQRRKAEEMMNRGQPGSKTP